MSDRIDPSQYTEATDFTGLPANDFPDGVHNGFGIPDIHIPAPEDYTSYTNPSQLPDLSMQAPAIVTTINPTIKELRYRNISGGGPIIFGKGLWSGYAIYNTGATPALVRFRDGIDISGASFIPVALPVAGSASVFLQTDASVPFANGLFVEIAAGTIEGTAFVVGERRG
jgi:hypothetical protein